MDNEKREDEKRSGFLRRNHSAEHGATIAATLISLLTVQVRVVENEGESSNK